MCVLTLILSTTVDRSLLPDRFLNSEGYFRFVPEAVIRNAHLNGEKLMAFFLRLFAKNAT